jgi:hypothetical protein
MRHLQTGARDGGCSGGAATLADVLLCLALAASFNVINQQQSIRYRIVFQTSQNNTHARRELTVTHTRELTTRQNRW